MNEPYLSAFCICGDAGVKTLGRALKSIIQRTSGEPLADEIIIGWNGENEDELTRQLRPIINLSNCDIVVHRQTWEGDFAKARNAAMSHCKGEWVLWFDSDDVIADAGDTSGPDGLKAIEAVERTYGFPPPPPGSGPPLTLKSWLQRLPFTVNCILAPYDYAILQDGSVTIRQTMRRILRRGASWVWRSFSGIHELPYPANSVGEVSIYNAGILNRHYPGVDEFDRLRRNAEIIDKVNDKSLEKFADARHAYDVATMFVAEADMENADKAIALALSRSNNEEDTFRYLLVRYSILGTLGKGQDALRCAQTCIGIFPERQEGYFAAAEMYYLMGKYQACINEYKRGAACTLNPSAIDLCVNRVVRPRANAAWSYCELGQPEKGLELATEAIREYPNDALAQRAYNRCLEDTAKNKAMEGLLHATDYLLRKGDPTTANAALDCFNTPALRGGERGMKYRSLNARVQYAKERMVQPQVLGPSLEYPGAEIQFYPVGSQLIDVTTFLNRLMASDGSQLRQQLLSLTVEEKGTTAIVRNGCTQRPIFFYCPASTLTWCPTDAETKGLGGSESAFVYLGRELAKRGYPVVMYCNCVGETNVDRGVIWCPLSYFDEDKIPPDAILINGRSPWIARSPRLKNPTYTWHQDNGYANVWSWGPEVEALSKGSFHVSAWQRDELLKELATEVTPTLLERHPVIGNGVHPEWVWAFQDNPPVRNPKRVIYASDPMRGLSTLLKMWPHVLKEVPDAELHVYTDFLLAQVMIGIGTSIEVPASREPIDQLKHDLATTPRVFSHGRIGQFELSKAEFQAGVYAYPGGMMPEGFGVSLVQAQAAGMYVLAPKMGALPEVLQGALFTEPVQSEEVAQNYLSMLISLLKQDPPISRRDISLAAFEQHAWNKVTNRVEAIFRKDGLIP